MSSKPHIFTIYDDRDNWLSVDYRFLDQFDLTILADPAAHALLPAPDHAVRLEMPFAMLENQRIASIVQESHAKKPIQRLFGFKEWSQYALAYLREQLSIIGPTRGQIAQYRNKILMKQSLRAAGVAVPAFSCVSTVAPQPIHRRPESHPLVIKPLDMAGGADVFLAKTTAELTEYIRQYHSFGYKWVDVEDLIDGPMFHGDCLMQDGKLMFFSLGRYSKAQAWNPPFNWYTVQVDPQTEIFESACKFCHRVLTALPLRTLVAHIEMFLTPRGWIFCEIAARLGGSKIQSCIELSHGVHLPQIATQIYAGLPIHARMGRKFRVSGYASVRSRVAGTVRDISPISLTGPFDLAEICINVKLGDKVRRGSPLYQFVFVGDNVTKLDDWLATWEREYSDRAVSIEPSSELEIADHHRSRFWAEPPDPFAVYVEAPMITVDHKPAD